VQASDAGDGGIARIHPPGVRPERALEVLRVVGLASDIHRDLGLTVS
jgi:hypothetical protein